MKGWCFTNANFLFRRHFRNAGTVVERLSRDLEWEETAAGEATSLGAPLGKARCCTCRDALRGPGVSPGAILLLYLQVGGGIDIFLSYKIVPIGSGADVKPEIRVD
jgi:hypothetical protein